MDFRKEMAKLLLKFECFDHFLAIKFPTTKRFGGEGAESMAAFYKQILESSQYTNLEHIVIGWCHRGKLNWESLFFNGTLRILRKLKDIPEFAKETNAACGSLLSGRKLN